MRPITVVAWVCMAALLASCGTSEGERTSGGAAAGAATGAGVGALAGPPGVVAGALIGGGAGAATGAATSPKQVNLGKPPWDNPQVRLPSVGSGGNHSQQVTTEELNNQSLRAAESGKAYSP